PRVCYHNAEWQAGGNDRCGDDPGCRRRRDRGIPPGCGRVKRSGESMIAIQSEDVDIGALINGAKKRGTGAIVVFDGIVRDDDIREMELEAYGEVAVPELEKIASEAQETYNLLSVDIIHRIGRLAIGENILVIVVGARHRQE